MKLVLAIMTIILFHVSGFAHEGGHGHNRKWIVNNTTLNAELLKYEDGKVFFLSKENKLLTYKLEELSPGHQRAILDNYAQIVHVNQEPSKNSYSYMKLLFILGLFLLLLSGLLFIKRKKRLHLSYGVVGCMLIVISACSKNETPAVSTDDDGTSVVSIPSNDITFMQSIFGSFSGVSTSSDDTYFYVSSNGIPDHKMMVGITNWQQQVPIDQDYTGNNSWAIPIQPALSDNPLSTKTNLLKGAIAIAANGIPIFNPLNNRGEDANAIGELDQWGGHCGRADDYHYHLPPTHLQSIVGNDKPIAYAVDGFPVYGTTTDQLDEYLGKFNEDGSYQYHTINEYPYFIAGMRGEVTLDPNTTAPENQVIPQAMTKEVRPALQPLNGASITDFKETGTNSYSLTYSLNNESYIINYRWDNNRLYTYEFISPDGSTKTETYQR